MSVFHEVCMHFCSFDFLENVLNEVCMAEKLVIFVQVFEDVSEKLEMRMCGCHHEMNAD